MSTTTRLPPQTLGNTVHFVAPDGPETEHGHCQVAFVVGTHVGDVVDLAVIAIHPGVADVVVRTNVPYGPSHTFGSWHERWHERGEDD